VTGVDRVAHLVQSIDTTLNHTDRGLARAHSAFRHPRKKGFQSVAQIAHAHDSGHARPTLQGMQQPLQFGQQCRGVGVATQIMQARLGLLENLDGFLGEYRRYFGVKTRHILDCLVIVGGLGLSWSRFHNFRRQCPQSVDQRGIRLVWLTRGQRGGHVFHLACELTERDESVGAQSRTGLIVTCKVLI